jgi:hypothetical protein
MADLVILKTYNTRTEAEIAKGLLKTNGISAVIAADNAGGMRPFPFQYVAGVRLMVKDKDLQRAKEIID